MGKRFPEILFGLNFAISWYSNAMQTQSGGHGFEFHSSPEIFFGLKFAIA